MHRLVSLITSLSRGRQLVLGGSLAGMLAVFMPWHAIGIAALGSEKVFTGMMDQNTVVGLFVLGCMLASFATIVLPLIGIPLPRLPWREPTVVSFLGGQSVFLLVVLMVMHTTASALVASDVRMGMYLALIGAGLVFVGGYLLGVERERAGSGYAEPLTTVPRHRHMTEFSHAHTTAADDAHAPADETSPSAEDRRMRLDI